MPKKKKKLYPSISFSNYRKLKIIKYWKKPEGKKHPTYRGTEIAIMSYFSETMQIRKEWGEIFNVLRKKPPIQNSIPYEIILQNWKR